MSAKQDPGDTIECTLSDGAVPMRLLCPPCGGFGEPRRIRGASSADYIIDDAEFGRNSKLKQAPRVDEISSLIAAIGWRATVTFYEHRGGILSIDGERKWLKQADLDLLVAALLEHGGVVEHPTGPAWEKCPAGHVRVSCVFWWRDVEAFQRYRAACDRLDGVDERPDVYAGRPMQVPTLRPRGVVQWLPGGVPVQMGAAS